MHPMQDEPRKRVRAERYVVSAPLITDAGAWCEPVLRAVPALASLQTALLAAWDMRVYTHHPFVPGMQPRSLLRAELAALLRADVVVAEKTNGVRMQLVRAPGMRAWVGVDRRFRVYASLARRERSEADWLAALQDHLAGAYDMVNVLDGELCWDVDSIGEMLTRASDAYEHVSVQIVGARWTPLDAIACRNVSLVHAPWHARAAVLQRMLDQPDLLQHWTCAPKAFVPLASLTASQWEAARARGCDGLILQNRHAELRNGRAAPMTVYKWKPAALQTVDVFVLDGGAYVTQGSAVVHVRALGVRWAGGAAAPSFQEAVERGVVIECSIHNDELRPERTRNDKVLANSADVLTMTLTHVRENIEVRELLLHGGAHGEEAAEQRREQPHDDGAQQPRAGAALGQG